MGKRRLALFVVLVGVIGVVFWLAAKQEAQRAPQNDTPTDVKRGELNDRQRAHSELYKGRRRDADKLGDNTEGRDIRIRMGPEFYGSGGTGPQLSRAEYIRSKTCSADAIVLATAISKESQLTPDEKFIFTDYQFSVAQVVKDDKAAPIDADEGIVVTQGGGKVRLDGQVIELVDDSQQGIVLEDKYLLFLKRVPTTGAYEIISGSARVDGENRLKRNDDPHKGKGLHGSSLSSVVDSIAEYTNGNGCSTS
jgi:hypothetical protein